MLGSIASVLIWMMMTNRSVLSIEADMLKPQFYSAIMAIQIVSTFFIFFVPAYFFALICYRKPYQYLGFHSNSNIKQVLLVAALLIITFPLSGALANLNQILPIPVRWAAKFKAMEAARAAQEAALIQITSFSKYLVSLVVIALLPALFEETFFRSGMQGFLTRWLKNPWLAIIITGVVFSLVHLSYYGFLVRFALGIVLGLVFYYSKNIWLSILFHFLFNGIQVTILYIMTINGIKDKKDIEANFPVWAGVVALAVIFYLFKKFKHASELQLKNIPEQEADEFSWVNNQS